MRTGSIGNRDAETLINTLVEPKKSILTKLRHVLLTCGFVEEAGYDAINVESYVSYSISNTTRFIAKFKWELAVFLLLQNQEEQSNLMLNVAATKEKQVEQNSEDGTFWLKLDPTRDEELIIALANFYRLPTANEP
jgi:hypothetical protein